MPLTFPCDHAQNVVNSRCLMLPADFYRGQFPSPMFEQLASKLLEGQPDTFRQREIGAALNGVAYRFRAATENCAELLSLITLHSDSPPFPFRYLQERELFEFFLNGQSCIECFAYCMYFVGQRRSPSDFPISTINEAHKITFRSTAKSWVDKWNSEPLSITMSTVEKSTAWTSWSKVRNHLAHRSSPGREFTPNTATVREINVPVSAIEMLQRQEWLTESIQALVRDASALPTNSL